MVYIHQAALSDFGKRKEFSLRQLVSEAWQNSGIKVSGPAALVVANQAAPFFTGEGLLAPKLAQMLDLDVQAAFWVNSGSAAGAAGLENAWYLLQSGRFDSVVVIAAEKMTSVDTAAATAEIRAVLDPAEIAEDLTMVKGAARVAARLLETGQHSREDWARVAVKNHANALDNVHAHLKKAITLEQVLDSRFVAEPLTLFDCSPISDGAAVMLLSTTRSDLKLAAVGSGIDTIESARRARPEAFTASRRAAERAYKMAGLQPGQVDLAEIHDAFTPFELLGLEACSLAAPGQAAAWLKEGRLNRDGSLPVNASGGLKGRGHPVGASGLAQVVELAAMMRGGGTLDAGNRQCGLAMSIGGLASQNFVSLVSRS